MTNLVFGGHFGFSPLTYLAHVEEMEVLWIMTQDVSLDISRKIQISTLFSRLNFIAPGLIIAFSFSLPLILRVYVVDM